MTVRILIGHVLDRLAELPPDSINCVVTSPPYWGLRDYNIPPQIWAGDPGCAHEFAPETVATEIGGGNWTQARNGRGEVQGELAEFREPTRGQAERAFCARCGAWLGCLGLEPDYQLYVDHLVDVFRAVRRALRPDGTLWLNLGDCYATGAGKVGAAPGGSEQGARWAGYRGGHAKVNSGKAAYRVPEAGLGPMQQPNRLPQPGLKAKDLVGIPWRVALALQSDGWWLRQDIIWAKPNPMPESVTDRCTKAHEYLFLLSKSERYAYDSEAIKEGSITEDPRRPYTSEGAWQLDGRPSKQRHGGEPRTAGNKTHKYVDAYEASETEEHRLKAGLMAVADKPWLRRNKRSVWAVASEPFNEAHFAVMPTALVEPCILAGCPEGGMVLDPFLGSGTVALVADRLRRNCIGIELNPDYAAMARRRIEDEAGLFAQVAAD